MNNGIFNVQINMKHLLYVCEIVNLNKKSEDDN